jgi:hypothetical protein
VKDCAQLIDSQILIRQADFLRVAQAIAEAVGRQLDVDPEDYEPGDYPTVAIESALGLIDMQAYFSDAGDLDDLAYESYYGQGLPRRSWLEALAGGVRAGDHLTFRDEDDHEVFKILFDGQGGYRRIEGRVTFDSPESNRAG